MTHSSAYDTMVAQMKSAGTPPNADDIRHHFCAGVYAKQIHIRAGYVVMSHKHAHDHLSILASGQVRVTSDDGEHVYVAPAGIKMAAGVHHAVHALQDSVWFCVHATDETDSEKVDRVLIQEDAS